MGAEERRGEDRHEACRLAHGRQRVGDGGEAAAVRRHASDAAVNGAPASVVIVGVGHLLWLPASRVGVLLALPIVLASLGGTVGRWLWAVALVGRIATAIDRRLRRSNAVAGLASSDAKGNQRVCSGLPSRSGVALLASSTYANAGARVLRSDHLEGGILGHLGGEKELLQLFLLLASRSRRSCCGSNNNSRNGSGPRYLALRAVAVQESS